MLASLSALIDHSLVQVLASSGASEPRYVLLEIVREYALEQLEVSCEGGYREADEARERHLAWCLARAEAAASARRGPEQRIFLERLEPERDNLQAALTWSARADPSGTDGGHERLLRLVTALAPFWEARGPLSEGRRWLETALASADTPPVGLRLQALTAAGRLAAIQGGIEAVEHWYGESLASYRAVGDRQGLAAALTTLGEAVSWAGPTASQSRAVALFEEALAMCRELGDKAGIARALNGLANVATSRGKHELAVAYLEESLSLQRDLGDASGSAETLLRLGECVLDQGDTARAAQLFDEHLAQARAQGNTITVGSALLSRGEVAMRRGEFVEAEVLLAESLAHFRKVDATLWTFAVLHRSCNLAAWQGHFEQAADRGGEGLTLLRPLGETVDYANMLIWLAWVTSCRGELERAAALARESLAVLRDMGDLLLQAWGLNVLGGIVLATGDTAQGRLLFQESLGLVLDGWTTRHARVTWWDKLVIVHDLAGLGQLAAAQGELEHAVRFYGASEACRVTAPFPLAPPEAEQRDCALAALRIALGEAAFATAWATGQAMSLDEAIALALSDASSTT
jgi:tetratricopeptide (TPR) repeat protein